jgi:uncharacterized protein YdaU (DUF1376 family)
MNYFELHIGDYEKATSHLTACEDGIYGRLLRRYYDTEAPLPNDVKAIQRLIRARTREEREAVETVLKEFFSLEDGKWHGKRCDEEIAQYSAKREKAKRSAEARWLNTERNANAMRTHTEGNAHQTPDTRHQSPENLPTTSGALAPVADPIFGDGLAFLIRKGIPEKGARSFLGAMRKEIRDDLVVTELLIEADRQDVSEPLAWLRAAGRNRVARPQTKLSAVGESPAAGRRL